MTEPTDPNPSDPGESKEPAKPAESAPAKSESAGGTEGPTPDSKSKPADKKAKTKSPKPKDPARWRKRIVRTFMLVIVIGLFVQILLWALLPWTLRRAAKFYNLDLTCDWPDLSLFNSDAGLWHVKVTQNGQPVANVDYCRADISILNLLRGKLIIQRLEADGVDLTVQRDADGSIPLLKAIMFAGPQPGTTPPPKTATGKPAPIDLRSPVAIDALVLTHVRTHIIDRAVKPELNTEVQMTLRLTDVGSLERAPKFSLELVPTPLSTPLLDSIAIEAGCKKVNDGQSIDAYFSASARGLHPKLLEGYLSRFGIKVTADGVAMAARGSIAIHVMPTNPNAIAGNIAVNSLVLTADNQDAATMKSLSIDLDSVGPNSAALGKIAMADGTFLAQRTAAGGFRVAGFEFTPGSAPAETAAAPVTPEAPKASPPLPASPAPVAAGPAGAPFVVSLGELSLKNFRASFKDAAVTPAADLEFLIDTLSLKNITSDPAKSDSAIAIAGNFSAPGILRDVKIDGACQALATKKTFKLNVDVGGIHPDALGPYFAMMGVESDLKSGRFTCQLTADLSQPTENSIAANARLANIKFEDGDELLALDDLNITGIGLSPGRVRIDAIDVTGPRAAARREKSGAIWAAGFRLKPSAGTPTVANSAAGSANAPSPAVAHASAAQTTKPAASAETLAALPKIDIGRFTWSGIKLHLDDQAAPEGTASSLGIEDAGVELTGLHIDFDPKAPVAANPAHLHAYFAAPGLAGDFKMDGTIAQRSGGLVADLEVTGHKLSAILAAPYLKALNVEPTLRDGSIHTKAHVDVEQLDDGIAATVSASEFQLSDPNGELLGADQAGISKIHLTADTLEIGEVNLTRPRGQFSREENGALNAVGFRLVPVPPKPKASAFSTAMLPPVGGAVTQIAATQPAGEIPATQPAGALQILALKKFSIRDGAFGWTDRMVKPTANITARVDGDLAGVTWGKPADPAKFSFTLKADGIVDEAKIAGTLTATPDAAGAKLDISAAGLRQGGLAPYLPPGMTIELKDGQFKTHVDAAVSLNPKGGAGGVLVVSALDYRDGKDPTPLFSLDSVKVVVPRIDLPGGVVDVDEISVTGAQTGARLAKDGSLHAMGIAIAPATQPTATTQPAAHVETAGAPASPTTTAPAADAPDRLASAAPLVIEKPKHPLVTLKTLDLNLKRFTLTDETREKVPPITVSDLRFFTNKPISALGKDPKTGPATDLGLTLKIDNVIDLLKVNLQIAPFASEPLLSIDVVGSGIHGEGLLAQAPDLKEKIDASQLTDGRLHAHVFAKIKMDRFDPLEFPFDRAFDVDAVIKNVEFRADEKGPILIGVDEIRSEGIQVHPAEKKIVAKTLEVENIVGQASREKDGIHAMGIVLKMPAEPTTQPTTAPATAPDKLANGKPPAGKAAPEKPKPPVVVATTVPAPDETPGEVRIDKFFITGMDFKFADNTVSPPLLVPLNQLDVDVRNLSTKAPVAVRPPTRFSVLVGAGKVPLPAKVNVAAVPAVKVPGVSSMIGPKVIPNPTVGMEDRDLFSQIQADGEMALFPKKKGWLKASVNGFDLASVTATVKALAPVTVYNGIFDTSVDARFPGDDTAHVNLDLYFTDLDFVEPPGGPVQSALVIPISMDVVLAVLERADGSLHVPVSRTLHDTDIQSQIMPAIGQAILPMLTDAGVGKAVGAVNAVGNVASSVLPLSAIFGQPKPKNDGPFNIQFSAGDDALSMADLMQLNIVLERMKEEPELTITLRAELTGGALAKTLDLEQMTGDIGRARLRANPSQEECRELINRLSRRKDDLIRRRLDVLGEARGDVVSRSAADSSVTVERLRAVERELSATEDALDRLYDMERPGAARQAGRRTKQAALSVARSRERMIIGYLMSSGLPGVASRLNITRPSFAPAESSDIAGGSVVLTVTKHKT